MLISKMFIARSIKIYPNCVSGYATIPSDIPATKIHKTGKKVSN
jgi:hypothetical protein